MIRTEGHMKCSIKILPVMAPVLLIGLGSAGAAAQMPDQAMAQEAARDFTGVTGYRAMEPDTVEQAVFDAVPVPDGDFSVFLGTGIGPLVKPILVMEQAEGALERGRYRVSYGMDWFQSPPPANNTIPYYFVQVDRFNLGPQVHEELSRSYGVDAVAPAEEFGVGPRLSYRMVMGQVRHVPAAVASASRREIDDETAADMDCLGSSCLDLDLDFDGMANWHGMEQIPFDIDPDYVALRDGSPTPAAVLDLLAIRHRLAANDGGAVEWSGGEPREAVALGEPSMIVVVDVNLGQDTGVDLVMRDGYQMDDSVSTVWHRVATVGAGPGDDPIVFADEAYEYYRPADDPLAASQEPAPNAGAAEPDAPRPRGEHRPTSEVDAVADCAKVTSSQPGAFIAFPSAEGDGWLEAGPGPVTVEFTGCSNTHEGNLNYELFHGQDADPTLEGFTTGGAMGRWERFSVEETLWTPGEWTFVVLEQNMESGSWTEHDSVTFWVD